VLSPWESGQPVGPGSRPAVKRKREYHINAAPGADGPQVSAGRKFELAHS